MKQVPGYTLVRTEDCPEQHGTLTLLTHDLSALPNDRTEVDGDEVFINVMDAALHPDAGYHPEYHKLYADLQIDITGGEGWGYTNEPGSCIASRGSL